MTAKEYLKQIGEMETKAAIDKDRIESIRESIHGVNAVRYSEVKTRTKRGEWMSAELGELEALENQAVQEAREIEKKKTEITEQIKKLKSQKHVMLLYLRYVKGKKLEAIAEEMNYALRHINRMHGDALREFEKINRKILENS